MGKGGRKGEKYRCVVASWAPPTGDLFCNPGMYPDWELNQQLGFTGQRSIHWATPARAVSQLSKRINKMHTRLHWDCWLCTVAQHSQDTCGCSAYWGLGVHWVITPLSAMEKCLLEPWVAHGLWLLQFLLLNDKLQLVYHWQYNCEFG